MGDTQPGLALPSMLRSMDAGIGMMALLGAVLCMAKVAISGLYPTWQVLLLGALNLAIVAAAPLFRARHLPSVTAWQALVAGTVALAAIRPYDVDYLLATDHLVTIACAVTTFRGGTRGHVGMVAVIALSAVLGTRVTEPKQVISAYLFLLCFYTVMVGIYRVIQTSATRTEETMDRVLGATRAALVSAAVQRDREERGRILHDTVLATLTAVGQGVATDPAHVRARCTADIALLTSPTLVSELVDGADLTGAAVADAIGRAVDEATRLGLTIDLRHEGTPCGAISRSAADALVGVTAEALSNVRRHSGVAEAAVTVRWRPAEVQLVVRDEGRGFDQFQLVFGMGLRQSVLARVRSAGGAAAVHAQPGQGTTIDIAVPITAAPS